MSDNERIDAREALQILDHRAQTDARHDDGPPTPELVSKIRKRLDWLLDDIQHLKRQRDALREKLEEVEEWREQARYEYGREYRRLRRQRDALREAVREAKEELRTIRIDLGMTIVEATRPKSGIRQCQKRNDKALKEVIDHLSDALDGLEGEDINYPHKPQPGTTHWSGCWKAPGHHNCAVAKIHQLKDRLEEATDE